jgi:hypothetical protein
MWPRDPFVEAEVPEQAEGGGEALLAVPSLVLDVGERGELCRCSVGRHRRELSLDPRKWDDAFFVGAVKLTQHPVGVQRRVAARHEDRSTRDTEETSC